MHHDHFQLVGKTIAGIFRVEDVVAEGGFGVVYRAYHRGFRATVALKCLKVPNELTHEHRERFLEQFRSEAEIMFRLSTSMPNIARPLHVDAVHAPSGQFVPFMALEWLEGSTLDAIIDRRALSDKAPLSLERTVALLTPVAHALDQAHHLRTPDGPIAIVHRDVKPENIFVALIGGEQVLKVLDFGISKVRSAAKRMAYGDVRAEASPFSPGYGAPEQWAPERFGATAPYTDVWGLALTMVEVLKGDIVIEGGNGAMMAKTLDSSRRPTPRNEGVLVGEAVEAVFQKALAVDPRYRYQSIRDFWDALTHATGVEAIHRAAHDETGRAIHLSDVSQLFSKGRERKALRGSGEALSDRSSTTTRGLPPMNAPTPWSSPVLEPLDDVQRQIAGLPPMLAPAPLSPSSTKAPVGESLPLDPASGLSPVPFTSSGLASPDVDVPPPLYDTPSDLTTPPRAETFHSHLESRLKLELEPTSAFPEATRAASAPTIPRAPRALETEPVKGRKPPPPPRRRPPPPPRRKR